MTLDTAFYIDVESAINNGYDLFSIFDTIENTAEFFPIIFDPASGEINEEISAKFDDGIYQQNILILDRVEISPEFRGKKYGLAAIYRTIQQFGHGCDLIIMKVFPLQFTACAKYGKDEEWKTKMELDSLESNEDTARNKLNLYYKRLGFFEASDSKFLMLNNSLNNPRLDEVGFSENSFDN